MSPWYGLLECSNIGNPISGLKTLYQSLILWILLYFFMLSPMVTVVQSSTLCGCYLYANAALCDSLYVWHSLVCEHHYMWMLLAQDVYQCTYTFVILNYMWCFVVFCDAHLCTIFRMNFKVVAIIMYNYYHFGGGIYSHMHITYIQIYKHYRISRQDITIIKE